MRVIRLMRHPAGGLLVTSTRVRRRRGMGLTGLLGVWLVIAACVAQPWLAIPTVALGAWAIWALRR